MSLKWNTAIQTAILMLSGIATRLHQDIIMGRFGAVRFGTGELAVLGRLAIVFSSPEFSKPQKKCPNSECFPTLIPQESRCLTFWPIQICDSKSGSGKHEIRFAKLNWGRRNCHGGAFSCSHDRSCSSASNNKGKQGPSNERRANNSKWTSGNGCKHCYGWNYDGAISHFACSTPKEATMAQWAHKEGSEGFFKKFASYSRLKSQSLAQYVDMSYSGIGVGGLKWWMTAIKSEAK